MEDCIFCKIIGGQVPAEILYEDQNVFAFKDNLPAAPVHILVIPKKHIRSLNDMELSDIDILGQMVFQARQLAKHHGLDQAGYRLVINTGPDAGQTVFHLHIHLLGGRKMPSRGN